MPVTLGDEDYKKLMERLSALEDKQVDGPRLHKIQKFPYENCMICTFKGKPVLKIKTFDDNKTGRLMAKLTVKDGKGEELVDMLNWFQDPENKTNAKIMKRTVEDVEIFPNHSGAEPKSVERKVIDPEGFRKGLGDFVYLSATVQKTNFLVEMPDGTQFETDEIIAG